MVGSGRGGGLALLVEFQEAGFLNHHGNSYFVVRIFQRCQGLFFRCFGGVPLPVKNNADYIFYLKEYSQQEG